MIGGTRKGEDEKTKRIGKGSAGDGRDGQKTGTIARATADRIWPPSSSGLTLGGCFHCWNICSKVYHPWDFCRELRRHYVTEY